MAGFPLLSLLVWLPTLGALALMVPMGADTAKRVAFFWSLLVFVISLALIPGLGFYNAADAGLQLQERLNWISGFNVQYFLGIDGISIWLVLLTTLLTPIAILSASWNGIGTRVRAFLAFMLLLETGMLGVFLAQDLFLFYIFWELTLVPMYFLIGIWGGQRRIYATVKFFLYTFAGFDLYAARRSSLCMCCTAQNIFSVPTWCATFRAGHLRSIRRLRRWMFACLLRRLCDQGAAVAVPFLAAGCAYRSADCRLGDPGGRAG